jgi:hypothetical protein
MLHRAVWYILSDVPEELTASVIRVIIPLMMEAVSYSEGLRKISQDN